ncbi:MAG: hypothetical protein ACREQQ_14490, partial [Candidatus Binatia bacterium]
MKALFILLSTYVTLSAAATFVVERSVAVPQLLVEDRESLWRLRPDFRGHPTIFESEARVKPVRIDERGFRASDGGPPDGRRGRILAVGDSFTFGW